MLRQQSDRLDDTQERENGRFSGQRLSRRAVGLGLSTLAIASLWRRDHARGADAIVPVVVLPGVLGSRLATAGEPNWDTDSTPAMLQWSGLDLLAKRALLSVAEAPELTVLESFAPTAIAGVETIPEWATLQAIAQEAGSTFDDYYAGRGWAGVPWGFYGPVLTFLEANLNDPAATGAGVPHPVYAFGYDWRLSCATIADKLAAYIDRVLANHAGAEQVILVTHSMGGLVARAACLDPAVVNKIVGVIHASQPSNGAIAAYRRFQTGYVAPYDAGVTEGMQAQIVANILSRIMGATPEDYVTLISDMPGPLEFLPNTRFHRYAPRPWLEANPAPDLYRIYDVYRGPYQPGVVPPTLGEHLAALGGSLTGETVERDLRAGIDGAEAFHARLADNAHPNTYVIYGTELKTDARVTFTPVFAVNQPLEGDGTVHESSSSCPGLRDGYVRESLAVPNVEHASTFTSATVNEATLGFIERLLSGS